MTRISDMTELTILPASGAYVPVEKAGSTTNYRYNLGNVPTTDGLFINASVLSVPAGFNMVATTGYSTLDVGGAIYVYDAAVNAAYVATNPRSSFISANLRGFRLSLEQDITPAMLGAGGGGADDTAPYQAAVNIAVGVPIYLPKAISHGAITLPANTMLIGAASKTVVTPIAGSYALYTITGSDVTVDGLQINAAAKTGGYEFTIACGTATIDRTTLRNILTFDSYGFLADNGSGAGKHVTTILEDVQARGQRGPGLALTRMFAYAAWTRVSVDFIGVSASNFTAFMVDGSALTSPGGLTIDDCNAAGTAGVFTNTSQIGFDLKNFSDISIPLARSDSMGGDAFRFTGCNKLEIGKALAQLCDGHGHVLTSVTNSDIVILRSMGRNALAGTASKDGVQIVSGCSGLSIERIFSRDMTGHGANVVAAQAGDVDVGRVQMLSNTGRGVKTVGASAVNIGGGQCSGNTAGNLDLGNALHFIDGLQISAGTKADYQGPVTA